MIIIFYSNYSFCVFDDWIFKIHDYKQKHQAIPTKNKAKKEFDDLQQNYQIFFLKGVGEYISCYDDSFNEDCIYVPIFIRFQK